MTLASILLMGLCTDLEIYNRLYARARHTPAYYVRSGPMSDMIQAQQGKCAICHVFMGTKLQVDHDHITKKIRALLCGHCNKGLGMFRDNPNVLRQAIRYLKKHQ